ncbi:MAG TPA: response regulator [Thermoanaerobaculia bacterium]|nr:response regulator [Thermoanaerobaculia bacterium]
MESQRQAATLVASNPKWRGIAWRFSDRRIQRCPFKEILAASSSRCFPSMPVERIVIEGALDSREFTVLLSTLHSTFEGDVLFVDRPDHAFLSAATHRGSRVLYVLSRTDIEFYVDVNELRGETERSAWRLLDDTRSDKLVRRPMRALIADSDAGTIRSLSSFLSGVGCETMIARSGYDALRLLEHRRPDVLVLDDTKMRGVDVARYAKNAHSDYQPRTIVLSPTSEAPRDGVDACVLKPVGFDQIAGAIF